MAFFLSLWSETRSGSAETEQGYVALPHACGKDKSTGWADFWLIRKFFGVGVGLVGPWKLARAHVARVVRNRLGDEGVELGVLAHELGGLGLGQPQDVVKDQHLSVGVGTGTNADDGNIERLGDSRAD